MSSDAYKTMIEPAEGLYKEKGSKFLAFAWPVTTEEEVKDRLEELKKRFHDARHYCYAWVIGPENPAWRANDDGEPGNSAGVPILNQIRSFELVNVLVVVVRYFGGTKLGVGGLVQAYKTAARLALEQSKIVEKFLTVRIDITYAYEHTSEVMRFLHEFDLSPQRQYFGASCSMELQVRKSQAAAVKSRLLEMRQINSSEGEANS